MSQRTALRIVRNVLVVSALALGATSALVADSAEAMAQTTRPEFVVGTPITALLDHSLPGVRAKIKKGTVGKVTKVRSSGGKVVQLDIDVAGNKVASLAVDVVRKNYSYPQ